jgi:1-acyl-sn-glycerol-3-phosphate acyltransferase
VQYQLSRIVAGPFLHTIWRPTVTGAENIPASGGAILAANHQSVVDSVFLPLMVDRPVTFSAKAEYFTASGPAARLWAAYLRATNQLQMDRDGPRAAQDTLEAALALLREGKLFGIYPEGTRSPDGRLYRGRPGVGWLALKSGLPVIPVALSGTRRVLPPGHVVPRPGRIEVKIGQPVAIPPELLDEPPGKARRLIADRVMSAIKELSGQEYVPVFASDRKAELAAQADGRGRSLASRRAGRGALRAQAEQLHRVPHVGEARLGGDLLGPPLDRPAFHLHAAPAGAAGQVVVVHAGPALPVQDLAAGVADGVDPALLAERLQVTVDGGQAHALALAPQLGVDLLGAAEAGQAGKRGGQRLRLPGPARPGAADRTLDPRGPDVHALVRLLRRHSRTVQP